DSDTIVRDGSDNASYGTATINGIDSLPRLRAPVPFIPRIGIIPKATVGGVDAIHVVHVAIAIVINAVARNLAGIPPHVVAQIFVQIVHARVEDRHDDVGAAGRN